MSVSSSAPVILTAAALLCLALPAMAQQPGVPGHGKCGQYEFMVAGLKDRFQESKVGLGLVSTHHVLELYVSTTGSWTVLFVNTRKWACVGAAGTHWTMPAPDKGR